MRKFGILTLICVNAFLCFNLSKSDVFNSSLTLQTAQAGMLDDLAEWYLSKTHDCRVTEEEVDDYEWGFGTWEEVQEKFDHEWVIEVGGPIPDDQTGFY